MNIHILRLKNGDDIICDMEEDNGIYFVNSPMVIWLETNGKLPKLCMDHWLPIQVVEDNFTSIKSEDVLCTMVPNNALIEYYSNTILEMNSVLHAKEMADQMSDNDIIEAILAMQEGSGSTFH